MSVDSRPTVSIRPARPDDASGIANVHLNSWREAYRGLLPEDFLESLPLTFQRRLNWWRKSIEAPENGLRIWIAENEKHGIVGFAAVEAARDSLFEGSDELAAIYLLKHYHRTRTGFSLLREGLRGLREAGYQRAYCWVLKGNPTLSFYQRTGARVTGDTKIDKMGTLQLHELACVWDDLSHF